MSPINAKYIKGPFKADFLGGYIFGSPDNFMFGEVRGWGKLSYEKDAEKIQDANLQFMVDALNEKVARDNGDVKPPSEAARTAYERLARYVGPQSEHRKNEGPLADVVINELELTKSNLTEAKRQLAELQGPECKDKECPDYDGSHPFHDNAVERFWREKQKEYVHKSEHERLLKAATSTPVEAAVEKWASDQLGLELEWLRFYAEKTYESLGPANSDIKRSVINEYLSKGKQLPKAMLDEMEG